MNTLLANMKPALPQELANYVKAVPDFPRAGIVFRDIMPLLAEPAAFRELITTMAAEVRSLGSTKIVGLESRGFIVGVAIAQELGLPFVAARKAGKLPGPTVSLRYELEYGEQTLEIQHDAIVSKDRVAIVDDLLATGGTAEAGASLVRQLGADISGYFFAIELDGLGGRARLAPGSVRSVMHFA